jgi:benzoyl-CoA reductase subunit BamC
VTGEKKRKSSKPSGSMRTNATAAGHVRSSAPPFTPRPNTAAIIRQRSRIRVVRDPLKDIYIPVYAGEYAPAECMGRDKYVIDGKEYDECAFCRASCPSRDILKNPIPACP